MLTACADFASPLRVGSRRAASLQHYSGDQHFSNSSQLFFCVAKELRFGTSAGATWGAITTDVTCGAINSEQDSLNPLAGLSPMVGMWLNCIFGGKGVGMINLLCMDRALRANVLAKSGKAVETAGDIDVVLLDKTGTITMGNRRATEFLPLEGGRYSAADVARLAALASAADETPEGKSIMAKARELAGAGDASLTVPDGAEFVAFTAQTRMSGINLPGGRKIRKGASDAIVKFVQDQRGRRGPPRSVRSWRAWPWP